jgi:hypothetical protein
MRRAITSSLMLAAAFGVGAIQAQTAQPSAVEVERQFDASLNAAEMAGWMKTMAAEPQPCRLAAQQGERRNGARPIP